jgi:hypothetical protein
MGRSIGFYASIVVALDVCVGCAAPSPNRTLPGTINETVLVELARDRFAAFARDLRAEVRTRNVDGHIGFNTGYEQPVVRETPSSAFGAALDDARRKATTIAAHERLRLGPVCAVSEASGGVPVALGLKGNANSTVRVAPNGPVAVLVDYAFGAACDAKDRGEIAVSGFAVAAEPVLPGPSEMQAVQLHLEANGGTNGAAVEQSLAALESAVDAVVKRYGRNARYVGVENESQF